MRKKSLFFVLPIIFSMAVPPAFAAAPIEEFVFQGVLKDSTGGLITGTKDFALRLYTELSSTTLSDTLCDSSAVCLWHENQTSISVKNGVFTINAGKVTPFTNFVNFTNALYMEVIVKSPGVSDDEVMSPRLALTSTPSALSAARASVDFDLNQKNIINATAITIDPKVPVAPGVILFLVDDDDGATDLFSIDEAGNVVLLGSLSDGNDSSVNITDNLIITSADSTLLFNDNTGGESQSKIIQDGNLFQIAAETVMNDVFETIFSVITGQNAHTINIGAMLLASRR